MPPESVLTAPRELDFNSEMLLYFTFGGIVHFIITIFFISFLLLIGSICDNHRIRQGQNPVFSPSVITTHAILFSFLLFLWGAPGYLLFLTTVTNKLYRPGDPLLEWLPLLPRGCSIFSPSFGGRLLNGATCNTLRRAWLLVAIPVWSASFFSYLCLLALWKKFKQ